MAGEAWPIDASSGAPSYTGAELRGIDSTLLLNGTADSFGARGGRRPGAGMVVTASALAWSVTAGAFIAYPRFSATQGPYRVTFAATEAGAYTAPHATWSRRDILSVVIDDAGAGDGSGQRQARIQYTAGTASASPVSPAVPARGTLLATLVVPPAGSPTVLAGPVAVAAGGVLPVGSQAEEDALTQHQGLTVLRTDLAGWARLRGSSGTVFSPLGSGYVTSVKNTAITGVTFSDVLVPGMSVTFAAVSGRRYRISYKVAAYDTSGVCGVQFKLRDAGAGALTVASPQIDLTLVHAGINGIVAFNQGVYEYVAASTGSKTIGMSCIAVLATSGVNTYASADAPMSILVEDMGV